MSKTFLRIAIPAVVILTAVILVPHHSPVRHTPFQTSTEIGGPEAEEPTPKLPSPPVPSLPGISTLTPREVEWLRKCSSDPNRTFGGLMVANGDKLVAGADGSLDVVREHDHNETSCFDCGWPDEIGRYRISVTGVYLGWKANKGHEHYPGISETEAREAVVDGISRCAFASQEEKPVTVPPCVRLPCPSPSR